MRGGKYSANIVLAAIDTTQRPAIYINGKQLPPENNGLYEFVCGSTGIFDFQGYLEVPRGDGSMTRHEFSSSYTVVEPSATISATLMNVLYAGIGNPISISVPGIPNHAIQATMTNGTLTRQGDNWIAKPAKVGQDAVITVTATMDGRAQTVANTQFRVRQLPDPMPFIAYKECKRLRTKIQRRETFPQNTTAFCARYSSRNRRRPVECHLSGTAIRNGLFRLYGKCDSRSFRRSQFLSTTERFVPQIIERKTVLYIESPRRRPRWYRTRSVTYRSNCKLRPI